MKVQKSIATQAIEMKFFDSIHKIPVGFWDNCIPYSQLFLHRKYLTAFEEAHVQKVGVRYIVIFKGGEAVAWAFIQLIRVEGSNLQLEEKKGKFIDNMGISFKNYMREKVNALEPKMLICGNPFITGQHGFYFSPKIEAAEAFEELNKGIDQVIREEKVKKDPVTAVMVKEFEAEMLEYARFFNTQGYKEVEGLPDMVLYLREEWYCFEDYLQSMTSKYRTRTKSYRKKAKKLVSRNLSLEEIKENQQLIFELYKEIADSAEVNLLSASPQYYVELKRQFGNQFKILGYYLEGKLVGFISYFVTETHLEAHYVGYRYEMNRPHGLYVNILYDLVNEAIKYRVKTLAFGRTAHEIKSTVGAEPINANSFMRHQNFIGNRILAPVINRLRNDDWEQRKPFKAVVKGS
ncbi:MAG: GNAT family N-acetyltransferase [Chitinophagales bacterium]